MKTLKKRKLRRIDRLGDRLQDQFQELLAPYFVTEDEIILLTENPDYVIEDKILSTSFTITEDILRSKQDFWVTEDNIIFFANETIAEDILKRAKAGYYIFEDHLMLVKDHGIQGIIPVRHAHPEGGIRTITILPFIADKDPKQKSFAGKLVGSFSPEGELEKLYFTDAGNKPTGKLKYREELFKLVKDPKSDENAAIGKRLTIYIDGVYFMTVEYQLGFFWETVNFWGDAFGGDGWSTYNHNH